LSPVTGEVSKFNCLGEYCLSDQKIGQILNYDGKKEVKYFISPRLAGNFMDKTVQPDSLGRFTITTAIDKIV